MQLSRRLLDSPYAAWLVLAAPAVWWLQAYWRETMVYGELLHASGELAARLLIVTLALTPLARLLPKARWLRWLKRRRRWLGVACFGYSLLHTAVYLERKQSLALILDEAAAAALWTGWLALVVMLVLAATSNDLSVARLGRRWQLLHRTVYAAAILSFVHWVLSAFDPVPGFIHAGVLAGVEVLRFFGPRAARAQSGSA